MNPTEKQIRSESSLPNANRKPGEFHFTDVLSITTQRLVSSRHIAGVYDVLNFMSGENLFTHQLPRVSAEAEPVLRELYPRLMFDSPEMVHCLAELDKALATRLCDADTTVAYWCAGIRRLFKLDEFLPVGRIPDDAHRKVDALTELEERVGADKIIGVEV